MSLKVKVNWNILINALLTAATMAMSAITFNACMSL